MNLGFPLEAGESIARVVHRSRASLIPPLFFALLLTIASVALAFSFSRYPGAIPFPRWLVFSLVIITAIIAGLVLAIGFYLYDHNLLVFTSSRLVQMEQLSLFNRRVSQLYLVHVQDATGARVGVAGTLFNYGDMQVQSAGETEQFIFHYAPNPIQLSDDVLQAKDLCTRFTAATGQPVPPVPTGA